MANSGTGANFNRYWYANNNPYKFTDPDGRIVKIASASMKERVDKEKENSELFKKSYDRLDASPNIHIIGEEKGIGVTHQSTSTASDKDASHPNADGSPGTGSGSTIKVKLKNEPVYISDQPGAAPREERVSFGERLYHEMLHSEEMDKGILSKSFDVREHNAKDAEDAYRAEQGLLGRRLWVPTP